MVSKRQPPRLGLSYRGVDVSALQLYCVFSFNNMSCQHMAPPNTCCKWLNQAETNYKTPHIFERLWSLSNDDTNRNETGNNVIGLDWQNNNFARASRFFVHFSAVVARLQRETACSNFTFCRRREHETTTLLFFSWTLIQSFRYIEFNSKKKMSTFDELNEMEWVRLSLRHCEFTF